MLNKAELGSLARRKFLRNTFAIGASMVAPGVILQNIAQARAPEQAANANVRWGLLIDTNLLTENDVDKCVAACNKEHGLRDTGKPKTDAQWIRKVNLRHLKTGQKHALPMMCQHCEDPPCVEVCPTGASFKRADGIVLVDKHSCIGCRYCMMACPFKARSFIHENLSDQLPIAPRGKGVVESCTLCVHRIDRDGEDAVPACAEAVNSAQSKPIIFGNLNNPQSQISQRIATLKAQQLREDLKINPGVHYIGLTL